MMSKKTINSILAILIILSNTIVIAPNTIQIFMNSGGPMGFGYVVLPLFIIAHLFLFPAILFFVRKAKQKEKINVSLAFGTIGCLILFVLIAIGHGCF